MLKPQGALSLTYIYICIYIYIPIYIYVYIYIYETQQFLHWKLYTVWHFSDFLILSLGDTRNEHKAFLGLKCTVTPSELMTRQRPSETPLTYGMTTEPLLVLEVLALWWLGGLWTFAIAKWDCLYPHTEHLPDLLNFQHFVLLYSD